MKIFTTVTNGKRLFAFLIFFICLLSKTNTGFGQTVLISPSGDGGFENGSTFTANGWTEAHPNSLRQWQTGNAAGSQGGNNVAYIGTTTSYNGSTNGSVMHFYRDVVIPAGATNVSLSFFYKQPVIINTYDYFYVFTTTPAYTPAAGTVPGTGYTTRFSNTGTVYSNWTLKTIDLTALAGQTVRLVFTHSNNGFSPYANPAVDDISLTYTPSTPAYQDQFSLLNTGSNTWCAGETRNVSVKITNTGSSSWTSSSSNGGINLAYWFTGTTNQNHDSNPRQFPFSNLASGQSQVVTISVTAPATPGSYVLNFDLVKEFQCWFSDNVSGCGGPGNSIYTSSGITVAALPFAPTGTTPQNPGPISGSVSACSGSAGNVYGVNPVTNATYYIWSVPSGWTITSGSSNNSITVTAGSTGGTVTVQAGNACGFSTISSLTVGSGTSGQWIGIASSDWNDAQNWGCGGVPTLSTDVIIPAGTPNDPVIFSGTNALAKTVTINNNASVSMNGSGNLAIAVNGSFTNNGLFKTSASAGTVTFNGAGTVAGSSITTFNNLTMNGVLSLTTAPVINGNLIINSGTIMNSSPTYTTSSTLSYNTGGVYTTGNEWNAGGSATVTPGFSIPQNVTIISGSVSIPNSGGSNRALAGNLTISSGTALQIISGTRDLYIAGNWVDNGTFTANGRKVTFDANSGTQSVSGSTVFYDLTLNNGSAVTNFGTSINSVNHEFRISAGTMNVNNTSTFIFTGAASTLEGTNAKNFYNLQINSGVVLSDMTSSAGSVHIANSFVNNGLFNQYSAHTTYFDKSGATNETLSGSGYSNFGKLTIGDGSGLSSATILNCSADFTVTGGSFSFFNGSIYNGNNNTATFSSAAATVTGSGMANFYNAVINVSFNAGNISKFNNNFIINTGGAVTANAPNYGGASTLIYNTTVTVLSTGLEWYVNSTTPGLGIPQNVIIQNTNNVLLNGDRGLRGNLTINSGDVLSLNDHLFTINGAFSGTGKLTGSALSGLIVNGSAGTAFFTQNIPYNQLKILTINAGSSLSLGGNGVSGDTLNIIAGTSATGYGTVTANGLLNANGILTLKSNAYGTAMIAPSGGTITGNVTVDRYIPSRRAWRFLSVPFSTGSQSINAAWQEGQINSLPLTCPTNDAAPAGLGTEITNNNTGNGYDYNTTTNPSLKVWINNAWTTPASTISTNITSSYPAYCLFVRGDRRICLLYGTGAGSNTTTLRAKGIVNQLNGAPVSKSYTGNGGDFFFVGNPYASSVNLTTVLNRASTTGINKNKFWVWDPALTGSAGVGGYVVFDHGIQSPPVDPQYNAGTIIQSGEAFMVQADSLSSNAVLTFQESDKNSTETNVFGRQAGAPYPAIYANLMVPSGNSLLLVDGVAAGFGNRFSAAVDKDDALKLFNFNENIELIRDSKKLAIEFRPVPKIADTLFLKLYLAQQPYALKIFSQNLRTNIPAQAWLVDKYLNTQTPVNLYDTTIYNFAPNTDTNSYRNRFILVFNRTNGKVIAAGRQTEDEGSIIIAKNSGTVKIYPNPVNEDKVTLQFININKGTYSILLYDKNGNKLIEKQFEHAGGNNNYKITLNSSWAAGVYTIYISDINTRKTLNLPLIISK